MDVIAYSNLSSYLQSKGKKFVAMSSETATLSEPNRASVILLGSFHNGWTIT